jgi:hypothetical protein
MPSWELKRAFSWDSWLRVTVTCLTWVKCFKDLNSKPDVANAAVINLLPFWVISRVSKTRICVDHKIWCRPGWRPCAEPWWPRILLFRAHLDSDWIISTLQMESRLLVEGFVARPFSALHQRYQIFADSWVQTVYWQFYTFPNFPTSNCRQPAA